MRKIKAQVRKRKDAAAKRMGGVLFYLWWLRRAPLIS